MVKAGEVLWSGTSVPELTMRRFSDSFLDGYIAAEGESLLGSVGAYRLESRGVQLFSRIDGDHRSLAEARRAEMAQIIPSPTQPLDGLKRGNAADFRVQELLPAQADRCSHGRVLRWLSLPPIW